MVLAPLNDQQVSLTDAINELQVAVMNGDVTLQVEGVNLIVDIDYFRVDTNFDDVTDDDETSCEKQSVVNIPSV